MSFCTGVEWYFQCDKCGAQIGKDWGLSYLGPYDEEKSIRAYFQRAEREGWYATDKESICPECWKKIKVEAPPICQTPDLKASDPIRAQWIVQCIECGNTVSIEDAVQLGLVGPPEFHFKWRCRGCVQKLKNEIMGIIENPPEKSALKASDPLRAEIHAVIRRYGQESDVTIYQTIGVLEIVKLDLVDMLDTRARKEL